MNTPVLRLGDREVALPSLEASLALGSTARLSLEAGPLRLSVLLDTAGARALMAGGEAFPVEPGEDPVFLDGEGILTPREATVAPSGGGGFLLTASGTAGWGASARAWTLEAGGRVDRLEVEAKTEKGVRYRLAEVLPAPPTTEWELDAYDVPELGLWRMEVDRVQA